MRGRHESRNSKAVKGFSCGHRGKERSWPLCKRKGVGRFWSGPASHELKCQQGDQCHRRRGAKEEFEEIAKGHIFKVLGSWLDLVEQWEVLESFKERNNTRGLMLAKAPLACYRGRRIGAGRNIRVSSHETLVSDQVFWGANAKQSQLLQDLPK